MASLQRLYFSVIENNVIVGRLLVQENFIGIRSNKDTTGASDYQVILSGNSFQAFFMLIMKSAVARKWLISQFFSNQRRRTLRVKISLSSSPTELLDGLWESRIQNLTNDRIESDFALSRLSTLGGAYSSLGDDFRNCAHIAGLISIEQFRIAMRLGEKPLTIRCKLYMALSLIQQGHLHKAKLIILRQFEDAVALRDVRLINMCKGIWAKLQYAKRLRANEE